MSILLLKPRICAVNILNPLTQGMVFCVPCDEGGGNPRDIVSGQYSTVNTPISTNAPTWKPGRMGPAVSNTLRGSGLSDGQYQFANNPAFQVSGNFTVAVLAYQTSFAVGTNSLVGVDQNFSFGYSNFQGQGNNWFSVQYWDAGGTIRRMGVTGSPSAGVWRNYAFTVVNSLPANIYYDGIAQTTSTNTASQARSTSGILRLAGAFGNANNWGDRYDLLVIWNRVLTPREIRSFARDPYQIFLPPRFKIANPLPAIATTWLGLDTGDGSGTFVE